MHFDNNDLNAVILRAYLEQIVEKMTPEESEKVHVGPSARHDSCLRRNWLWVSLDNRQKCYEPN